MSKSRAEIQNGYWSGGEIEGRVFNPLNVSRKALLQATWAQAEEEGINTAKGDALLVAMAIYNMCDLDADNTPPDFEALAALAREKGLGRLTLAGSDEFEECFTRDANAIVASQARISGDEG